MKLNRNLKFNKIKPNFFFNRFIEKNLQLKIKNLTYCFDTLVGEKKQQEENEKDKEGMKKNHKDETPFILKVQFKSSPLNFKFLSFLYSRKFLVKLSYS